VPPDPSPWRQPSVHADRRPFLLARNAIQRALRRWFEERDFIEVDTAALQVSPGNETHLHAFATTLVGPDGRTAPMHLHTSPEFACKKLLSAGETRIFTFAKVWRNRERGTLHHPEFTMLEWYRARAPYEILMDDCAALVALAAESAGSRLFRFRDREADPFAEPQRVTVSEAFDQFAGIDLIACEGREALAAAAARAGVRTAGDDSWSDVFSRILVEKIEPNLGIGRPTVLCEYPAQEAALARTKANDPRLAERFELYVCGIELANAFGELTDAAEQRRRFEADMQLRQDIYGERYPIDEDLLDALNTMPPASGAALGFERLSMLAAGAERIDQVIWTPVATHGA
jgi:elongation factor P--(R)-beta-lysine ligase